MGWGQGGILLDTCPSPSPLPLYIILLPFLSLSFPPQSAQRFSLFRTLGQEIALASYRPDRQTDSMFLGIVHGEFGFLVLRDLKEQILP